MRRAFLPATIAALAISLSSGLAVADPPGLKTLAIGASAPDFQLPGVDGKTHALKDFADAKVLAIIFTCNHCPTAQAYEKRIAQLDADYRDRGVAVVAISPNDPAAVRLDELGFTDLGDSFEDMKLRAKEAKITYPYLYDGETQETAKAFGVMATPHVYIFDKDRKLRYVGRIDDSDVKTVKSHDARNAIDALLEGKPVPVETTRTFGCSTKWSEKRADAKKSLAKWDAEPVEIAGIGESSVATLAKNDTKDLLLVNLWATWCGPCVAEMDEFVTMHRMYRKRNFKLVMISMDKPEKQDEALKVLREHHASTTNYLAHIESVDKFAEALDAQWQGPLPYTLLIAPGGKIIYRKSGSIDPLEVRRAVVNYLGRTY